MVSYVEAEIILMNSWYSVILKFIDPSQTFMDVLSMQGFLTSCIHYLENIGSPRYADLQMLIYFMKQYKIFHLLISPSSYQKSLYILESRQALGCQYKFSKIQI